MQEILHRAAWQRGHAGPAHIAQGWLGDPVYSPFWCKVGGAAQTDTITLESIGLDTAPNVMVTGSAKIGDGSAASGNWGVRFAGPLT